MKQTTLRTALAAGIALLMPLAGYSQQQLGGTTADKKMQGNSSSGSAMGGLYTPSLYDGTANINIPIYQYSADGGNYGISLGYNTRGVKVDELAGQVGLHWQLMTGGSIQRAVKDIPDDAYDELYPYIEVGSLTINTTEAKVRGRLFVYGETTTEAAETDVYRDKESDDYMVSVGNLSFTFNLGKDGFVFTNPQRNVKVELMDGSSPVQSLTSSFTGMPTFRITDEQGNRYFFIVGDHRSDDVQDKYGYQQNVGSYAYATSWVISKVITASGAEIKYTYSTNGHSPSYAAYNTEEPGGTPGGAAVPDNTTYAQIESIIYPNNITALFKYDDVSSIDAFTNPLREIQLISNGEIQLRYKMNQSYWVAADLPNTEAYYNDADGEVPYGSTYNGPNKNNYRLKLNSISILGKTGPEETFYSFTYDPVRLPRRFNGSQDYFGYYNHKTPTPYTGMGADPQLSIPDHQYFIPGFTGTWYGVDRSPDVNYLKAAILTKINNAFGGEVDFLYDEHVLGNVLTTTNTPGYPDTDQYFMGKFAYDGLRLQAIVEKDIFHVENYRKTIFTYADGQLFLNGGYFHYLNRLNDGNHTTKTVLFTNQYISRHQLVNGANHGYSSVTVKTVDENNNQLSRTIYSFSNFKDGSNAPKYQRVGAGSLYFFEFPFADKQFLRDWEMGLPLSTREYDQNDRVVLETINTYVSSIDSTTTAGKIENTKLTPIRTDWVPQSASTLPHVVDYIDTYRPFRGKTQLISSQTKKYIADNSYVDDAVTYKYDGRNNITYTLANNSKGEYFKTENIYNYDLASLPGSGLQAFTDAGLEKVVSTQRWKTDATGNTYTRLMDGFINTFDYSSQQVKPKAMYTFIPGDAVTATMYAGGTGLSNSHGKIIQAFQGTVPDYFRKTSEVILSDAKGNPLESRMGDQDIFKAMIWDEVTGQKLAEAGSCHYADIAYCGFETPGTGVVTRGNVKYDASVVQTTPGIGSLYAAAFPLSASSGSIEGSQSLAAGKYVLSFWANGTPPTVYSGTSLLTPVAMDEYFGYKNYRVIFTAAANDKFKIEYNSGGTTYIDDVRLHPFTAQMENWSYTPLFGAGINTGVNGRPTFVQYDGQGRPKIVRDKNGNIISKTEYGIQ